MMMSWNVSPAILPPSVLGVITPTTAGVTLTAAGTVAWCPPSSHVRETAGTAAILAALRAAASRWQCWLNRCLGLLIGDPAAQGAARIAAVPGRGARPSLPTRRSGSALWRNATANVLEAALRKLVPSDSTTPVEP